MATTTGLVLEVARDSNSPGTYRATVDYDVTFEASERRDRARFRDTFLLSDADDGSDRDDLLGVARGAFRGDRPSVHLRLTIRGLTEHLTTEAVQLRLAHPARQRPGRTAPWLRAWVAGST